MPGTTMPDLPDPFTFSVPGVENYSQGPAGDPAIPGSGGYYDKKGAYNANVSEDYLDSIRTGPKKIPTNRDNYMAPGYAERAAEYQRSIQDVLNRQKTDPLHQLLMQQVQGQNSIAQQQLRQAADTNISQQMGMAAGGRGNPVAAARMASQNIGRINQGIAGQAAQAGIQERQAAAAALGQQQGQTDNTWLQLLQQQMGNAGMQQQGGIAGAHDALTAAMQRQQIQANIDAAKAAEPSDWEKLISGGTAALTAASKFMPVPV